jgi:hypothetical protein
MHRWGWLGVLAMSGCMASGIQLTRDRAAFDLSCPKEQIQVQMLSGLSENGTGSTFGATGCGKKATYIRQEVAGVTLNSQIQSAQ